MNFAAVGFDCLMCVLRDVEVDEESLFCCRLFEVKVEMWMFLSRNLECLRSSVTFRSMMEILCRVCLFNNYLWVLSLVMEEGGELG